MADFEELTKKIRFPRGPKDIGGQADVVAKLDAALKASGDLGVYGDLSGGAEDLLKDMSITMTDRGGGFGVDCGPISGGGHDFQFHLPKSTWTIDPDSISVGEVLPEPEDDEFDEEAS